METTPTNSQQLALDFAEVATFVDAQQTTAAPLLTLKAQGVWVEIYIAAAATPGTGKLQGQQSAGSYCGSITPVPYKGGYRVRLSAPAKRTEAALARVFATREEALAYAVRYAAKRYTVAAPAAVDAQPATVQAAPAAVAAGLQVRYGTLVKTATGYTAYDANGKQVGTTRTARSYHALVYWGAEASTNTAYRNCYGTAELLVKGLKAGSPYCFFSAVLVCVRPPATPSAATLLNEATIAAAVAEVAEEEYQPKPLPAAVVADLQTYRKEEAAYQQRLQDWEAQEAAHQQQQEAYLQQQEAADLAETRRRYPKQYRKGLALAAKFAAAGRPWPVRRRVAAEFNFLGRLHLSGLTVYATATHVKKVARGSLNLIELLRTTATGVRHYLP